MSIFAFISVADTHSTNIKCQMKCLEHISRQFSLVNNSTNAIFTKMSSLFHNESGTGDQHNLESFDNSRGIKRSRYLHLASKVLHDVSVATESLSKIYNKIYAEGGNILDPDPI